MFSEINPKDLCDTAFRAGSRILQLREQNLLNTERKDDGSPVTCADHESQAIILQDLHRMFPNIPVIAEEQDHSLSSNHETYWLVDPLDGTRDFITGNIDFSVNIGLIHQGHPVVGIIYAPARNDLFYGSPEHRLRIKDGVRQEILPAANHNPPRLTLSLRDAEKNPIEKWLAQGLISQYAVHASAYKMALVAVGEADLFLRTSVTREWDTAAGEALLRAVGGRVITPDGADLAYNKSDRRNGDLAAFRAGFDASILKSLWN